MTPRCLVPQCPDPVDGRMFCHGYGSCQPGCLADYYSIDPEDLPPWEEWLMSISGGSYTHHQVEVLRGTH